MYLYFNIQMTTTTNAWKACVHILGGNDCVGESTCLRDPGTEHTPGEWERWALNKAVTVKETIFLWEITQNAI